MEISSLLNNQWIREEIEKEISEAELKITETEKELFLDFNAL